MNPKFSLGELVSYQGLIYKVRGIYALNWFTNNPFVYSLELVNAPSKEEPILIAEPLIEKIT